MPVKVRELIKRIEADGWVNVATKVATGSTSIQTNPDGSPFLDTSATTFILIP